MSFDLRNEGRGFKLLLFISCILDSFLSAYVWDASIAYRSYFASELVGI